MSGYLHPNRNYLVTIAGGPTGISVQGNAMTKLSLQVDNKWINILEAFGLQDAGGVPSSGIGQFGAAAMTVMGVNFWPTWATSHVWRGSTGIELSLDMRFDAVNSAVDDVVSKVKTLISAWMPIRTGSLLQPPGPTPADLLSAYSAGGGVIGLLNNTVGGVFSGGGSFVVDKTFTATLGNFMIIRNLIPTTIQWEFENRFEAGGQPIAALVKLGLISYTVPSNEDMMSYFNNTVAGLLINPPAINSASTPAVNTPTVGGNPALTASTDRSSTGRYSYVTRP